MKSLKVVIILLLFAIIHAESDQKSLIVENTSSSLQNKLLFASTIDGRFLALDPYTGKTQWMLQEAPVLKIPAAIQSGFAFFPDPQDGSLYVYGDGRLKKLPFTIPQLVQNSPCKSKDGVLYAGRKQDVWFAVDPRTGKKFETLNFDANSDKVCPAPSDQAVFIGRTEYQITMIDGKSHAKRWNATFTDYSSHVSPSDYDYGLLHYTSTSDGRLVTVEKNSGDVLWKLDCGSPIVGMYIVESEILHRIPFTIIGKDTLDDLLMEIERHNNYGEHNGSRKSTSAYDWFQKVLYESSTRQKKLFPTLFIGEFENGFYALPSLVDNQALIQQYRLRLEGPPEEGGSNWNPMIKPPVVDLISLGHYELPEVLPMKDLIFQHHPLPLLPDFSGAQSEISTTGKQNPDSNVSKLWIYASIFLTSLSIVIGGVIFSHVFQRFWTKPKPPGEPRSIQTSKTNINHWLFRGRFGAENQLPDGHIAVGKIAFNPIEILGRGCEGTVVYKGLFDGRPVAVKRIVSDFVNLADREVSLLRESDNNANVIRYFCMEADSQFRYIALELCWATLYDFVERPDIADECTLSALDILRQASCGLEHLHQLKIVHRDIKPHNVLLSLPSTSHSTMRALISDFGLCKKLTTGKNSLSKRSGAAGTDGWIAPEVLTSSHSVTYAVDIFSLGCVYYYVLAGGKHPFGDCLRRQANILSGEYSLKELAINDNNVHCALVESMITSEPSRRPTIKQVLKHPFFWSYGQQLTFFQDVSDRVEKEENDSIVVKRLEHKGWVVVKQDWHKHICSALEADLRRFRTYRGNSVRDLLRAMRNKKHHYRELPEAVRNSLGHIPDAFVCYFTSRFPNLLLHTYDAMRVCAEEPPFANYYDSEAEHDNRKCISSS